MGVFTDTVCPILGNILAVIMLVSPLPAVVGVRKSRQLGALNPLPYPLTALNCFGWIAYGVAIKNAYVLPANLVGLAAGLYFSLQVLPHVQQKMQDTINGLLVFASIYFGVLGFVGIVALSDEAIQRMWGIQSVVILLMYYAIPLSSMVEVIRTRDASSIYPPLAVAAVTNGTMWFLYGMFGVHDVNLWVPNGIGAVLGVVQVVLRLIYGVKKDESDGHRSPGGSFISPAVHLLFNHHHHKAAPHKQHQMPQPGSQQSSAGQLTTTESESSVNIAADMTSRQPQQHISQDNNPV